MRCLVSLVDCLWVEFLALFRFGCDVEMSYGPLGEWTRINWTRSIITLGDPTGTATWRFRLDKYNHLELYRGICGHHVWKTDHNLTCWRNLEAGLKKRIDNKMNEILLEE